METFKLETFKFGPEHVGQTFKRRDGASARIVACVPDAKPDSQLIVLHPGGAVLWHYADGLRRHLRGLDRSPQDIMPPTRKSYVGIFLVTDSNAERGFFWASGPSFSEEEVLKTAKTYKNNTLIKIVEVELPTPCSTISD